MNGVRTLLILSEQERSMVDEVEQLTSILHADVLLPPVRKKDLLSRSTRYDIVWCVGHADESGFWLNETELLNANDFAAIVRHARANLLVLNACKTELLARRINYDAGCNVIATTAECESQAALGFAIIFARRLSELLSAGVEFNDAVEQAFTASVLKRNDWMLLSKNHLLRHAADSWHEFERRLRTVEEQMKRNARQHLWLFAMMLLVLALGLIRF